MIISAAKAREAAEVLGICLEGLIPTTLAAAYRTKAKECHPDHHGSEKIEQWSRINWANECLKHYMKNAPLPRDVVDEVNGDCRACAGKGRIPVRATGFGKPLMMQCVMCQGTGSAATGGAAAYTGE